MPKQQAQRKAKKLKTKDHGPPPLAKSVFFRRTMLEALITLFLIVAILAVFWPVKNFRFLNLDDEGYVTDNPQVLNGLSFKGVTWAFTTMHSSNWHPLTWLSHMLDIELYGLNPGGHHLTNLLFHIANILLLFFILKQMTGAPWRSGFVAALFALHPPPCGIGCVGGRAQGCVEYLFLDADHRGLCPLRSPNEPKKISPGLSLLHLRSDVQAHACHPALCVPIA